MLRMSGLQASAWFFLFVWTENCYLRRSGSVASVSGDRLLFGLPYGGSLVSAAIADVLLEEFFPSAVGFLPMVDQPTRERVVMWSATSCGGDGDAVLLLESSCRVTVFPVMQRSCHRLVLQFLPRSLQFGLGDGFSDSLLPGAGDLMQLGSAQ